MLRKVIWSGLYAVLEEMSPLDTIADTARAASHRLAGPKPSLMAKRTRGEAPKDRQGGPSPFLVVGVAVAAGIVLAKWIDWRGHAHPYG
jgi:hypothetical protein